MCSSRGIVYMTSLAVYEDVIDAFRSSDALIINDHHRPAATGVEARCGCTEAAECSHVVDQ